MKKLTLLGLLFPMAIMQFGSCSGSTAPGLDNLDALNGMDQVSLVYPANGSQLNDGFVSFLWKPGSDASIGSFEIDIDGVLYTPGSENAFAIQLEPGVHSWKVRGDGSEWTSPYDFEIREAPEYQDNDRTAFFDDFVAKTMIRTAWSDKKWEILGTTFENELASHKLRAEFANADTKEKMTRAIFRLNNIRKDHHLALGYTEDMIENRYAPVKFYPDLSDEEHVFFFAANFTEEVMDLGVERGDKLIAVNGIPLDGYLWLLEPYICASTKRHMNIRYSPEYLGARNDLFGAELYLPDGAVKYVLEDQESGNWYEVTLQYGFTSEDEIPWLFPKVIAGSRSSNEDYYRSLYEGLGFTSVFDNQVDAALYLNRDERLAVVEWYDLEETETSIRDLMAVAERENALDYDLVIDGMFSSGGSGSEYVVQALTGEPFTTTFGNVRIEDVEFVNQHKGEQGQRVEAWIEDCMAQGMKYTTNEPFKLRNFPVGSEGVMQPAEVRFTGKKVMLFFPWGGSNLDQFASMVADNPETGIHTMGMSMGGYSNTWEWGETLEVPLLGEVFFEWNIGHTIRPNGEVLEGNPALATEWVPFTRENFATYQQQLIRQALTFLGH
jgi:hypothetical protein